MSEEPIVEGVLDETSAIFGPFAKKDGYHVSFAIEGVSLEAMDLLYGTDTRTIEGEVIQGELTDGQAL